MLLKERDLLTYAGAIMSDKQDGDILFSRLVFALPRSRCQPVKGARLMVAPRPEPFVSPTLRSSLETAAEPFAAEVIFVEASAAVGKSTMARYLSASQNVPLLDLAVVPVSTGSLKSLISDLSGDDPVRAFHRGELAVIVDALDEGRLLSGETGFESFLQTTGEFLLQSRDVTSRPKLVILGRHESIEEARSWLQLVSPSVTTSCIEVAFFSEPEARKLIDQYALAAAGPDVAYRRHPEPAKQLIDAYFDAIEAALGLDKGTLWTSAQGRAFAGYAPVLAALGSILAELDNFKEVANRLLSEGRQEAWSVIETVLDEILKRERGKVCEKLAQQIKVAVPAEAYDAHEQLTFLARHLHNQPLGSSSRVKLPMPEQVQYSTMVKQYVSDHPFVRQGRPSNPVLGSMVLGHAIVEDLLSGWDTRLVAELSRQPFLWRSIRSNIGRKRDVLLDGAYLGFVLNSYWNDPITKGKKIQVNAAGNGLAIVSLPTEGNGDLRFNVALPLQLYAQIRDCEIDVEGEVALAGQKSAGGASFYVYGNASLIADVVAANIDAFYIDGQFWLEAGQIAASPRLSLRAKKGSEVGWGGKVADTYPWNGIVPTLPAPYTVPSTDLLTALLSECALRLPARVLVVSEDYTFSESEHKWAARSFPNAFPQLLKLLVKHGLATPEPFGTYAQLKYRIHMNTTWSDLRNSIVAPTDPKLSAWIAEARATVMHR
jgi:hypothetical protein